MKPAQEESHSNYAHPWAMARFDCDRNGFHVEHCATLVKVLASPHRTEQEAARLKEINQGKDCTAVVRTARFVSTADR